MDSRSQGVAGLPLEQVSQSGSAVRFEISAIGGVFEGKLEEAGTRMTGQWRQGAGSLPLTFRRLEKEPELQRPQDPRKPYPYREEEVLFENRAGGVKLAGTLTLPGTKGAPSPKGTPAVLLVTGSGPQDRNEAIAGHRPFLVLADRLTRLGLAVLRVDDRGVGGSTGDLGKATLEDLAQDALAGVGYLKGRKEIDPARIGLIGHSEGGLVAPMAAAGSTDLAFLVLLAAPGLPGEQILYLQSDLILKALGAPEEAAAKNRQLQELAFGALKAEPDLTEAGKKIREALAPFLKDPLTAPMAKRLEAQLPMTLTPGFRFFLTYDPRPSLGKVRVPVLALTGELDLQVPPKQNLPEIARALEEGGNSRYAIAKLPRLNHLLQTAQTGSPMEYAQIEETIAPLALDTMAEWILRVTGLKARE
ncbi:MAG: alpha/beta hydrolase [Acidobacteria bacterium]|nr:alpha/beta hydrolase [Acidobacteriota bacterium]